MEERLPDGGQVFRASWHSPQRTAIAATAFMAVLLTGAGLVLDRMGWVLVPMGLLTAWFTWWLARPMFKREPVVQVGPQGVSGHLFRGHTVPWAEIETIEQQLVQGQEFLVLVLRPQAASLRATRSLLGSGRKRNLQLTLLTQSDRPLATEAVLQAFHRHGGAQAQRAVQAVLDEARAQEAFERRLLEQTPSLWALYAVVALNVGVWLANLVDGLSPLQPATADLFRWGAGSASAVVRDGELWRLVTATVLHGGLMHLALNMFALWVAGTQVCRWFGNRQFLLIYWGSALAGSALSLHFSAQQAVSVGASGAVFGVLGALLAGVYQHRERVPKALVKQLLTSQGLFVVISLAQGFGRTGIDNAAHVGGLLGGAVMAWLLIERVDEHASGAKRRARQVLATGVMALAVGGLVWAAQPGVDHRALFATQVALRDVLPQFQAAEAALQKDAKAQQVGQMSEAQLVDAMEQRHIPAYRAVGDALQRLGPTPSLPQVEDLRLLQSEVLELMTLEVGKARGTIDADQADARVKVVMASLQGAKTRIESRSGQASTGNKP
jgi:rhomboid protease GluP